MRDTGMTCICTSIAFWRLIGRAVAAYLSVLVNVSTPLEE